MAATFDREYDDHNAIVSIHAGAGGVDAADWTQMLARMYVRWAERKGFAAHVAEESPAEEAGLKSVDVLRARERMRTVSRRASAACIAWCASRPSISSTAATRRSRRSTSCPKSRPAKRSSIEIKPEDVRVETYKAGGAGGQYVNKTESAIRIIHLAHRHRRRIATRTLADAESRTSR
jgi:peptide chain release factor 2